MINIFTFSNYWDTYHEITGKPKLDKQRASNLWFNSFDPQRKKLAIASIKNNKDTVLNGYEYLQQFLRFKN